MDSTGYRRLAEIYYDACLTLDIRARPDQSSLVCSDPHIFMTLDMMEYIECWNVQTRNNVHNLPFILLQPTRLSARPIIVVLCSSSGIPTQPRPKPSHFPPFIFDFSSWEVVGLVTRLKRCRSIPNRTERDFDRYIRGTPRGDLKVGGNST